jgi:hypothetical protein
VHPRRGFLIFALLALTPGAIARAGKPQRPAEIVPLGSTRGRISAVNARLHFVVVDCGLNPLPVLGARLAVVRGDKIVGRLKVTGPSQGNRIAADIIEGGAAKGDDTFGSPTEVTPKKEEKPPG